MLEQFIALQFILNNIFCFSKYYFETISCFFKGKVRKIFGCVLIQHLFQCFQKIFVIKLKSFENSKILQKIDVRKIYFKDFQNLVYVSYLSLNFTGFEANANLLLIQFGFFFNLESINYIRYNKHKNSCFKGRQIFLVFSGDIF